MYSRAESNLHHWAGRLLIAKGQYITQEVASALRDTGIDRLFTAPQVRVDVEHLAPADLQAVTENTPVPFALYDKDGNCLAGEGARLTREAIEGLGAEEVYYCKSDDMDQAAQFVARYSSLVRARLDNSINYGKVALRPGQQASPARAAFGARQADPPGLPGAAGSAIGSRDAPGGHAAKPRQAGIPLARFVRRFTDRPRPPHTIAGFEAFYGQAVSEINAMWESLASGGYLWNADLAKLVDGIVSRFASEPEVMAALASADVEHLALLTGTPRESRVTGRTPVVPPPAPERIPAYPEHGLATATYCLLIADQLGYNRKQARDLVAAALFHDVGYIMIPKQLLDAERTLSKGERRIIFRHIEHNLFLLSRIDWDSEDFQVAVYQHHERGTGAGYPTGYKSGEIHEYALVVAVADVFHALISKRPHRKAFLLSEAMKHLVKMAVMGLLDYGVAKVLVQQLSMYPIGAWVALSTNEMSRVVAATRDPMRPWVAVILESNGSPVAETRYLDLSKLPGISIRAEAAAFGDPLAGF